MPNRRPLTQLEREAVYRRIIAAYRQATAPYRVEDR